MAGAFRRVKTPFVSADKFPMRRFCSYRLAFLSRFSARSRSTVALRPIFSLLLPLLFCGSAALAQGIQTFPAVTPVGNTASLAVTVRITAAGTAAAPLALTGGVAGLDFAVATGGTCAAGTAYNAGQQCTVLVQFAPKYPGQRSGAIQIQSAGGDLLGNALIAGTASGALPVLVPGRIDTVAGSGPWVFAADNVPATVAPIYTPEGIAVDPAGNLILSDTGNNRVRRVDAQTGIITTIAGNGVQGYSGDGGPATQATLNSPGSLILDGAGNVYFTDTQNHIVRRLDAITRVLTIIAGTPQSAGYRGDGGLATQAVLNLPQGLAFDGSANLLIADTGNHVVRRVDATTGIITTIAGTGVPSYNGDGRLAVTAELNAPSGLLVLPDGSILIGDTANDRVRRIDAAGMISTIAGSGPAGYSGDGGPATAATLKSPVGLAVDPVGDLYIADSGNNRVRVVDALSGNITTLAGNGGEEFTGDAGPSTLAGLYDPFAVVFTQGGDLYLSDLFHMRIRRISGSTAKLSYATIRRGKVSPFQLQQLANKGNLPLQLGTPALVNAALDSTVTTCSTTALLAPSATCALGVEFAPTTIGDDVMGSVTLPSNATNVTPVIMLDGQVLDVNPTSVTVTSSANPSIVGATVVFTAAVTSDDTGRSGDVTFTADGSTLCSGPLGTNGMATCSTSSLALGSHRILAQYAGDAQNAAATSAALTQVVKQQATMTITSSSNPSVVSNAVTFTVALSAPTGTPSGTVTFLDGTTPLGTTNVVSGQAMLTVSTLAIGTHAISVQYSGDTQNAPSTSGSYTQTVQQASTTTMLATSNATVPVGTSITLTATVTSTNGPAPTGSVSFTEGATTYGTAPLGSNGVATFTFSNLTPGMHALVATYTGDTNSKVSSSAALTETVQQISTTTALTADSNPLSAGGTLHLTAQVAMVSGATAYGPINGQVAFLDGSTTLATVPLNNALTATLEVHGLAVGSHTLTAVYQGNANYASSAGTLAEVVVQTATTATLTSAATPTLAGRPAMFTVAVSSSTGTPTGNVTLADGGNALGSATLNAQGTVAFSISTLSVGTHTLTATYGGSASYLPTTTAPITQTVNLAVTTVTLSGPATAVNVGAPATFTGMVSSPGVRPTGTLTLQEGSTVLASQPVGASYTFIDSNLPAGQHTLTVVYSGDSNNAAAQSAPFVCTVQQAPTTTTLTSSGSPTVLGTAVTLTAATTSVTANPSGNVTFFDGTSTLAVVALTNGTATLTTTALAAGSHTLTATYAGDGSHAASTSAPVVQRVVQQATVALSSSLNPSNSGQAVVLTAMLPAVAGTTPTGNVVFTSDGAALMTVALDGSGYARVQTSTLPVGTHTIMVTYAGDTAFSGASASLTQVVHNATTTTTLTTSADPAIFGAPLSLTATILSNGGGATGAVSFTENGIAIGSAPVAANGVAVLTLTTLTPGRHAVMANYLGDGNASASSSAPVSFRVLQTTTLTLGSPVNPSLALSKVTLTATLVNSGASVASGSVTFSEGATTLGTVALDATGRASIDLTALSVGTHTLTASYAGDDADFPAAAPALQQVVQRRSTVTALTTSATNAADAQQVTLIAVVESAAPAPGVLPTGIVTFTSGSTVIGQAAVDAAGVATLTIHLDTAQTETLVATYSGDTVYNGSTSGKASVTSGQASQFTLTVSNLALQLQRGQRTTVNVTVASVKGFNDLLKFGCVGLPYAATCTFSQVGMQLAANGSGTLQLTIDTGDPLGSGSATGNAHNSPGTGFGALHPGAVLCLLPAAALLCFYRRRRWMPALAVGLMACAATLGMTGCAGLTMNSTPAGSYTFQVTALGQGSGATQAQTITLTVTP